MSSRNLVESFSDPKRVQMIRGLINQMMTFLEDKLSIITGPYEDLISIEDVIEQGRDPVRLPQYQQERRHHPSPWPA